MEQIMSLDTPTAGPSESLSVNQATEALSSLLDDDQPAQTGDRVEPKKEPAADPATSGTEDTASACPPKSAPSS